MLTDIHTHILHGIDDGPDSLLNALSMLSYAEKTGIDSCIATPHLPLSDSHDERSVYIKRIEDRFLQLKKAAKDAGINIDLYNGAEVYYRPELLSFIRNGACNLGMSDYVLIEVSIRQCPSDFEHSMHYLLDNGVRPVLAHPERTSSLLGDLASVARFVSAGIVIQATSGSVIGDFGVEIKEFTAQLINAGLVHIVASDAHPTRMFTLHRAYEHIQNVYGTDCADMLCRINPQHILHNRDIETVI